MRVLFLYAVLVSATAFAAEIPINDPISDGEIERLAAFAKLYGYIRFFHPSDQAAKIDWIALAVDGVKQTRQYHGSSEPELFRDIFGLIAPTADFSTSKEKLSAVRQVNGPKLFWQHFGVHLSLIGVSRRVETGSTTGERAPLFPVNLDSNAEFVRKINRTLWAKIPLVAELDAAGSTLPHAGDEFETLSRRMGAIDVSRQAIANTDCRVAGVIIVWNVIQHFSPYLEFSNGPWESALRPAIYAAVAARSDAEYAQALLSLVAKLRDGHGFTVGLKLKAGGLPFRVSVVEDKVIITAVDGLPELARGDIIETIDGHSALDEVAHLESYSPGSNQLSRFRALNRFGAGEIGRVAELKVLRASAPAKVIRISRSEDTRSYFSNGIPEFTYGAIAEIEPGVFYVNIPAAEAEEFSARLVELANAKGIIFDQRLCARHYAKNPLEPHSMIIPHLIDKSVDVPPVFMPLVTRPDHEDWSYSEPGAQKIDPATPRFRGKCVFINGPFVVSSGENYMSIVANYKLAQTVGEVTAGCNGAVNQIPVPGGFKIAFTQMKVLKHDGTAHYLRGYQPDIPVVPSIKDVRSGRDTTLDAALAVARGYQKPLSD